MTTAELVEEYVQLHRGELTTPAIVRAWAVAKYGRVSLSLPAIAERMRQQLRPHAPGVFVAQPRPLPRPWLQGQLGL